MGDFGDAVKMGFGGGVTGDYWLKDDYAFGVDIQGDFFSAKDDILDAIKAVSGPNYQDPKVTSNVIAFNVHGIWAPKMQSGFQPWITYGVGLNHITAKISDTDPALGISGDSSENKVGFNVGVGADMKAGASMKIGPQVKYNYIATEGTSTTYVTAGLHLTFMTAGVTK
jgi:opacity protein-like surface antigen